MVVGELEAAAVHPAFVDVHHGCVGENETARQHEACIRLAAVHVRDDGTDLHRGEPTQRNTGSPAIHRERGGADDHTWTVVEGAAFGRYFLSDRWGLEVGWRYTNVDVNVAPKNDGSSTSDLAGNLKYDYSSLRLGVIAAF